MAAVESQQTEQQRQEEERKVAECLKKIMMRRRCVSPSRIAALETLVRELGRRLCSVEECLLGMDSMRGRMFQLEKSMESALDRIMPRLDALLAGLPASAHNQIAAKPSIFPPFPPFPTSGSAPTQGAANNNAPPATARTKAAGGGSSSTLCGVCHSKAGCSCAKNGNAPAAAAPSARKERSNAAHGGGKERHSAGAKERTVTAAANAKERSSQPKGTAAAAAHAEKQQARAAAVVAEKKGVSSADNKAVSEPNSACLSTPSHILESLEKQLRDAASRGDVVACQKIMLKGVDSKKRDPATGDTPLHLAARGGHLGCIMLLLAVAKSTATSSNKQRQTPLMVAAAAGQVASVQLLLHQARSCGTVRQGGAKALRQVAADGRDDILQALLDGGVSPHPEENSASSPSALHLAAANGHTACVRLLIESGADVALTNSEGQTALHKAAMNGHSECVAALLAAGSNPLEKDTSGWEALHLAARAGHTECVKLVLAYGVELCRSPTCRLNPLSGVGSGSERLEVEEKLLSTAAALGKPAGEGT